MDVFSVSVKRIGELIAAERYLNRVEQERYPAYQQAQSERNQRTALAESLRAVIGEYNEWMDSIQNEDTKIDLFLLNGFSRLFASSERVAKGFVRNPNVFVLPAMRDALTTIIGQNTHLTEHCETLLAELNSDAYQFMEPTEAELNPPLEPEKEYRFSLGDRIHIGTEELELLPIDDARVELFDPQFPLFHRTLTQEEFDAEVKECIPNIRNVLRDQVATNKEKRLP